ncbi:DUF2652 domain-containing protein [uncultured Croceitalea sp.]|uniref:DUF2652 domain-containing protein n=1 Tax=uncultured Croceitalea sp. TaxID=1798908 RepID=UPI0033067BD4
MALAKSLLFIPDISGFTHFVQTTEVQHSEHVIAELLEVLISSNTQNLKLAEVEGDALFFYKENHIPSQEKLLAQVETMYTAFYSHLKMMETNRICPCLACANASALELKIVLHCGELQFMTVQGNRKPFGQSVIQAHRLLKNSVNSNNYVLVSKELSEEIGLQSSYESMLFRFRESENTYDGTTIPYLFAEIEKNKLKLHSFEPPVIVNPKRLPDFVLERELPIDAYELFEMITNYRFRHLWVDGVDEFQFDENEVTRAGTEHVCVINGKHFNFTTVIKDVPVDQLIYGELTTDPPPVDKLYQFYILESIGDDRTLLKVEQYWTTRTLLQKFLMATIAKKQISKGLTVAIDKLERLVVKK